MERLWQLDSPNNRRIGYRRRWVPARTNEKLDVAFGTLAICTVAWTGRYVRCWSRRL